ncbi:response regulator transcription factor [Poseidonibacter lekithochrous]|uniref:response regulator transcription factor n=1 Tax=Poseidonibacter TaxID=2321187 RepID=UPI001C091FD6|nr:MULTISPECIES: response regulator transcription factor [Poseidonibacter]MBU3015629.1 response regulator transcription factor [Poseidonibacter lekithochrous]MDO6828929.1 response regulator transcription factor [Poseidonibacter sp. 1_MG-2023]
MKILLMEDDLILNEIIREHLEEHNYEIVSVFDGEEAQDKIYSQTFDLLLLDVNVPNLSGFDLLKDIRSKEIKTAAIFITSANMLEDIKEGFNSGCDDYIKKPFELKELDLRINNIKRLHNISPSTNIELSRNISLDIEKLCIRKDEEDIHITQKECDVLLYLVKNKNKNVSIEELSLNVWAYEDSPIASTIRTYIKNLRKIVGEEYILNTRGVGYRFNG